MQFLLIICIEGSLATNVCILENVILTLAMKWIPLNINETTVYCFVNGSNEVTRTTHINDSEKEED